MKTSIIKQAFILAAGLGLRMRPITEKIPKPMVEVAGQSIITRIIDVLITYGIERIVINASYRAKQLIDHVNEYMGKISSPIEILFSEEEEPLETGGGITKALPLMRNEPFFVANSDSLFLSKENVFSLMNNHWQPTMKTLFLLCEKSNAVGYEGRGDFFLTEKQQLKRTENAAEERPYIYTGLHITTPALFKGWPVQKVGLMEIYKTYLDKLDGMHGLTLPGTWLHIGTPDIIPIADTYLK